MATKPIGRVGYCGQHKSISGFCITGDTRKAISACGLAYARIAFHAYMRTYVNTPEMFLKTRNAEYCAYVHPP